MFTSESYVELVSHGYSQASQAGNRPYPVACYEIYKLDQAQQRAKRTEADLFRQFGVIFDWDMTRQQRNAYLKKLSSGSTLVLTDPTKTILWASQNFLAMTGYTAAESVGQTPGMLQGPNTDHATVFRMRDSLQSADSVEADLLNYRKNGEPYTCRVAIDPIYNSRGELTHFLAVEHEVK
jgi:PAS domain S-box-containing protein